MDYEQNAHLAAAPAYALESDSESDWDDDELPRPHSTAAKELAPDAAVTLEGSVEGLSKGREAVFLLGEAGERLAQGVRLDDDAASLRAIKVVVDGEQVRLRLTLRDLLHCGPADYCFPPSCRSDSSSQQPATRSPHSSSSRRPCPSLPSTRSLRPSSRGSSRQS